MMMSIHWVIVCDLVSLIGGIVGRIADEASPLSCSV